MNSNAKTLIAVVVGTLIGATSVWFFVGGDKTGESAGADEDKPLYWVAPMDSNYRRDEPGLSPMGMELVPVYADSSDAAPGTISISPEVVNNLGVRTALAERGHLGQSVNTVGYVNYDEDRLVHIHPRVEGWIEKLSVKAAGDPVQQGEPLYSLYSPTLVNAQEELLLALKRNNPALIEAAADRLTALQVPEADIKQLQISGKVQQTITITAPQSGVLDNLDAREGMFVKPGMEIMSIGMLEHIWVIGEVFERQASLVKQGDSVTMRLDYLPGREWQGQVDYIYPSLNTITRTAQVRVHFDNPDGYLRPGMFAAMTIETAPSPAAVLIPREALIRTGNQARVVLALGEGRFKSVEVKVGRVGDKQVEILAGLEVDDCIVTSAQFLIDSESSKTSDFQRMATNTMDSDAKPESVWVSAQVEKLMSDQRKATLAHGAIEAWGWPEMIMDFDIDDAVDMAALSDGMEIHIQIRKQGDSDYRVSQVHIMGDSEQGSMPEQDMEDHDAMSGSETNKKSMDHSQHKQGQDND